MKKWALFFALLTVAACNRQESPVPATPQGNTVSPSTAATTEKATPGNTDAPPVGTGDIVSDVVLVDLENKPLTGMIAIAVSEPNAFAAPVAKSAPSKEDGKSQITFPSNQRVFIRGWDPNLRMFSNNFYEVPAGPQGKTEAMTLIMVPGTAVDVTLVSPEGRPLSEQDAEMMMFHPTRGPWWPARGHSNAEGRIHFRAVPPGKFTAKIKTKSGALGEVAETAFQPASQIDLGRVVLK